MEGIAAHDQTSEGGEAEAGMRQAGFKGGTAR